MSLKPKPARVTIEHNAQPQLIEQNAPDDE
jgi:hypothetical protein